MGTATNSSPSSDSSSDSSLDSDDDASSDSTTGGRGSATIPAAGNSQLLPRPTGSAPSINPMTGDRAAAMRQVCLSRMLTPFGDRDSKIPTFHKQVGLGGV